jgi:protein-L-isoaspartate(D-aspartate) O-methyltransferase
MLEALELGGGEVALEVGTGYGWQTALLALLTSRVWSVERLPGFALVARRNLAGAGIRNAAVVVGDGSTGLAERAPFDAIVVAAAFPEVPRPLGEQLREGGRLVQPLGHGGDERVVLFRRTGGRLLEKRLVTRAHFVRLYGAHGFEE